MNMTENVPKNSVRRSWLEIDKRFSLVRDKMKP